MTISTKQYAEVLQRITECEATGQPCILLSVESVTADDGIVDSNVLVTAACNSSFEAHGIMDAIVDEWTAKQDYPEDPEFDA